ncbi:MAG TPA: hypothetical protein VFT45_18145 [Longimicrobium sp.]|nr:hypothetical protein [Longimicrobium sp.]
MRKLKLGLEDLAVQSFATDGARGPRGTAHAHADTAIGGDAAYITDPGGTSPPPGETQPDLCLTCELSCRGC